MRLSVLEGSLAQVFLNWTTGSVLTGYMLHLGASANQLALVASVPLLAQAASPLAAYLVTNLGHRKLFTMLGAGLGRGLRSEEHTSELQSRGQLVCRLLL